MINVTFLFIMYIGFGIFFQIIFQNTKKTLSWQKFIGESFFIGVFFIILISNIIQLFGLPIPMNVLFYIVLSIAIASLVYYLFSLKDTLINIKNYTFNIKSNIFSFLIIIIILLHIYYIISQNQALPLTPWDAWFGWVAKAKIWYYHGIDEILVQRPQWLLSSTNFTNPTAHYPDALPLIYVFNSGLFGWNETALNAIYPSMFIAFLLAFYGNIKLSTNKLYALIAVFSLITIPFVNVHVTLAGYADIWVASFLMLSIFYTQALVIKPNIINLIYLIIFLVTMVMFKLESWVWLNIFIIVLTLNFIAKPKRKWMYMSLIVFAVVWYIVDGFNINSPFGEVILTPHLIKIPALGTYVLSFVNTTSAWLEALFYSHNWNLLWYSTPFALFFYFKSNNNQLTTVPAMYLIFTVIFLYVLFYMTYASIFVSDFTSSNRIVLHIVPLFIYFVTQVTFQYMSQKKKA